MIKLSLWSHNTVVSDDMLFEKVLTTKPSVGKLAI